MIVLISFQVRDYIHVVDLADGHIAALCKLDEPGIGMCYEIDLFFLFYAYLVLVDSLQNPSLCVNGWLYYNIKGLGLYFYIVIYQLFLNLYYALHMSLDSATYCLPFFPHIC